MTAVVLLPLLTTVTAQKVRLVDGPSPQEGRLEVYYNDTWGTVCDDKFTHLASRVVCHMLGYENVGQYIGNDYGAGNGTIWLDDVRCRGMEPNIAHCQHRAWGSNNCEHKEDVSVACFSKVRLVGDSGSRGRLEMFHNGTWGTVCDNGFTDGAARVVCNMLGYGSNGRFIGNVFGCLLYTSDAADE